MKGSYYANPVLDEPSVSNELRVAYPEYYGKNICELTCHVRGISSLTLTIGPSGTPEVQDFEEAFKDLGR